MAPMKNEMNTNEALAQFDAACWKAAHRYIKLASVRRQYDLEDLHSVAQMAVLRALEEYDEDKGTKLSTHVINMIRWELGHLVRTPVTEAHRMPTVTGLIVQDEERSDFVHPEHHDDHDDSDAMFESLTSSLDERSKRVAHLRLIEEMTFAEIGEELGVSGQRARQLFEALVPLLKARAASFIA